MRLESLDIKGFRNLKNARLDFKPGMAVFALTGNNGQGKTNLLEAIFLLAVSKSFRTNATDDLIAFGGEHCSLKGRVALPDDTLELELIALRRPADKHLKVNGVRKKAADFVGHLGAVFFSPDDIGLIHLSPQHRRRYLDLLLSQIDRDYLVDCLNYRQTLKQRNSLLARIGLGKAREDELDFWDHQLAGLGERIAEKRGDAVSAVCAKASDYYRQVSGQPDDLAIRYLPTFSAGGFLEALQKSRPRDLALGSTQKGPHRDDLVFLRNGNDMAAFASRGEWRSLVLTLKFAEVDLLKEATGHYPVLLLDDVFSELDDARQKTLFGLIKNPQTFITTTHREFLSVIDAPTHIYEVREGEVV